MSVDWELKFQAPAPPFKIFTATALFGTNCYLEMNNIVSTNATVFVLFVHFCAN